MLLYFNKIKIRTNGGTLWTSCIALLKDKGGNKSLNDFITVSSSKRLVKNKMWKVEFHNFDDAG